MMEVIRKIFREHPRLQWPIIIGLLIAEAGFGIGFIASLVMAIWLAG